MYEVRLDKYGVEFGACREEFPTLKSLYDWIEQTYGDKVGRWLLEEDGSGGDKMPPMENIAYYVDNERSVDLEGWLKKPAGGCTAYFFHIVKEQDLVSANATAESMERADGPEICDTEGFVRLCQKARDEMLSRARPAIKSLTGVRRSREGGCQ